MSLEKRVKALEKKLLSTPLKLHFADGNTKVLFEPRTFLLDLFAAAPGTLTSHQTERMALILKCSKAEEPGGARFAEVLQSLGLLIREWWQSRRTYLGATVASVVALRSPQRQRARLEFRI